MKILLIFFYLYFTLFFKDVYCTTDINLAEMEYIANQLTPMECETLDKYLHSSTYEVTTKRDFFLFGERTCLEILLHWNSSPNEGLGETHSILSHRLRQIGRKDLSDWLSNIIFGRLSAKLNKTVLQDPFKEAVRSTEFPEAESSGNNSDMSFYQGEPDWETYDTVAIVVAVCIFISIFLLICELCGCWKWFHKKKKKVKIFKNKKYKLLTQEEGSSIVEDSANKS